MNFKEKGQEYLKNFPIRSTDLKTIAKSPKRFLHERLLGYGIKETPAIRRGLDIHEYFLQRKSFRNKYHVMDINRITPSARQEAELRGKYLIKQSEVDEFVEIKTSYEQKEKPHGIDLFGSGVTYEGQIQWSEDILGDTSRCTAQIDAFYQAKINGVKKHVIIDLKTTSDAKEKSFLYNAYKLKYHIQIAHYIKGYCKSFAVNPQEIVFCLVALETSAPYCHNVFLTDGDSNYVSKGEEERREAMATLIACCNSGDFPEGFSYPEHTIDLDFPAYIN